MTRFFKAMFGKYYYLTFGTYFLILMLKDIPNHPRWLLWDMTWAFYFLIKFMRRLDAGE